MGQSPAYNTYTVCVKASGLSLYSHLFLYVVKTCHETCLEWDRIESVKEDMFIQAKHVFTLYMYVMSCTTDGNNLEIY